MEKNIDQGKLELESQKTALMWSMTNALSLIGQMKTIEENEASKIQMFIAYKIPRCNKLFEYRRRFRAILKDVSLGKIDLKQAIEDIITLKYEVMNE